MAAPLIPFVPLFFPDADGNPLSGAKLYTYVAGTSTPQATYEDADLSVANPNPVVMGVDGRPPDPIFLLPTGYKFVFTDEDDVELYSIDNVADVGAVLDGNLGTILSAGSKEVASGYEWLETDRLVTVDNAEVTDPAIINLPAVADCTQPVMVKNFAAVALAITPNGSDTIEGIASAFTVPAASSPTFPCVVLLPYGSSEWLVIASHGF